jgi:Lon protease-like protein
MDELGLFPLGIVLLPTERIPLHIFEPRYRELIGDCLETGAEFGLVLADEDGLREIGTRAAVVDAVELPDGRLNIVVCGGQRFRLLELTGGRSFQTGRVGPIEDGPERATEEDVSRAVELFARVVELAGGDAEAPDPTDPALSFALAGRFELQPASKQQLLEDTSERSRLRRVVAILDEAVRRLERQRAVHALSKRNGDARSRPLS